MGAQKRMAVYSETFLHLPRAFCVLPLYSLAQRL